MSTTPFASFLAAGSRGLFARSVRGSMDSCRRRRRLSFNITSQSVACTRTFHSGVVSLTTAKRHGREKSTAAAATVQTEVLMLTGVSFYFFYSFSRQKCGFEKMNGLTHHCDSCTRVAVRWRRVKTKMLENKKKNPPEKPRFLRFCLL